jgi:exonuclease I
LTFENIEAYVLTPGTTLMGYNNVKFNADSDVKLISGSNYYNFFNIGSLTVRCAVKIR